MSSKKDYPPVIAFVETVEKLFPENGSMLEIGVWKGETTSSYSTIVKNRGGKLYLIDWFMGNTEYQSKNPHGYNSQPTSFVRECLESNIKDVGCEDITTIIEGDSTKVIDQIEDNSLDLIFVDGGHTYDIAIQDLRNSYKKIKVGGVIAGHDYNQAPVRKAVDKFAEEVSLTYDVVQDPKGQKQPIYVFKPKEV